MRLPFSKPKDGDAVPAATALPRAGGAGGAGAADEIEAARLKARRRLIGALVLLIAGVIAFPLVFETQPRPIAASTPVEAAREMLAAAPPTKPATPAERVPAPEPAAPKSAEPSPAQTAPPATTPVPAPAPAPPPKPTAAAGVVAAPPPAPLATSAAADGARAKALLEGSPTDPGAAAGSGRFVVQIGAYAASAPMREVRSKVEKLGLKTYTQVIENAEGKRTRLRVGPFSKRAEAEAAAAKLKEAGFPGNLLTL